MKLVVEEIVTEKKLERNAYKAAWNILLTANFIAKTFIGELFCFTKQIKWLIENGWLNMQLKATSLICGKTIEDTFFSEATTVGST